MRKMLSLRARSAMTEFGWKVNIWIPNIIKTSGQSFCSILNTTFSENKNLHIQYAKVMENL